MTPKERARIKRTCGCLFRKWVTLAGLRWWHITCEFSDTSKERDDDNKTQGECDAMWQYREATITLYLPEIEGCDDDKIERLIVHELAHVLICEMREDDTDMKHEERVATSIADALIWTRNGAKS